LAWKSAALIALALAANKHDARGFRILGSVECCFERAQHRDVERVEFFGTAERDDADRAILLEGDEFFVRALSHAPPQRKRGRACAAR
jgi:hypothetical protein